MKLNEALSLLDELEKCFKDFKALNVKVDFPKLTLMESFQFFADEYSLCFKEPAGDENIVEYVVSVVRDKGLGLTSFCDKYWMIQRSEL